MLADPFRAGSGTQHTIEVYGETLRAASAMPGTVERKGPLRVGPAPAHYHQEVVVNLPPGWQALGSALHDQHASRAFDYASDTTAEGGTLKSVFDLDVKAKTLSGSDMSAHLAELLKVQEGLVLKLQMSAPASLERSDRERRLQDLIRGVMNEGSSQ